MKDLDLRYAVNTNWDLFEHTPSKTFYAALQRLVAAGDRDHRAVDGGHGKLPDSFSKLPADDNWKDVKAAVPGKKLSSKTDAEGVREHHRPS